MKYKALSIVFPNGQKIVQGQKTLEIRSWLPDQLPLKNLVIVENKNFLNQEMEQEQGVAIALVDIESVHPWKQNEFDAACANYWEEGCFAWVLSNIRLIDPVIESVAKRKIYDIELDLT